MLGHNHSAEKIHSLDRCQLQVRIAKAVEKAVQILHERDKI